MSIKPSTSHHSRLLEVIGLMLKLGFTAFGGPAAHVALLRDEVVTRRKWVTDEHFLDLLGATNLIPGPNSTEMMIHLGYVRAGWMGLIAGGVCFVTPATLITIVLAWVYVKYGTLPEAGALLYGIKPVVIAVIVQALWNLGQKAVKGPLNAVVGIGALALYFLGIDIVLLLLSGGLVVMLIANARRIAARRGPPIQTGLLAPLAFTSLPAIAAAARPFSLGLLFLTFLKIGAVLYGSGYTLLAFVQADFVDRLGWLSTQQVIDAVAVGQVTPGPLFTTATFIGYTLGGVSGALLATLGIFLPSLAFVAISNPFIPKLRGSPWTAGFLDGVNACSLGLMAAITVQLTRAALVDWITLAVAVTAGVLLFRFKINATWLIVGGAAIGLAVMLLG